MLNFYTFGKRSLSTRSSFFDRARSDFEKREAMLTRILARMKGASEVGLLGWYPNKESFSAVAYKERRGFFRMLTDWSEP